MKSALFFAGIGFIVTYWYHAGPRPTPVDHLRPEYDFIVVGAGSAGGVVASRLSENPNVTVLLVEAGGMDTSYWSASVPGLPALLLQTEADWQDYTTPQKHACKSFKDQKSYWPRGKVLGGTSVLNWMHYVRGAPEEFDEWEKAGNTGWGYKQVLPMFKRSEGTTIKDLPSPEYRGTQGPLLTTRGIVSRFGEVMRNVIKKHGKVFHEDGNGPVHEGFSFSQHNVGHGVRQSTAEAFIRPAMASRSNLDVLTHATVKRINFDAAKSAESVAVELVDGKQVVVKVGKEVVLSAGAVSSPQVLMWSGIGPEKELKKAKISPVHINPHVGQHMEDHVAGNLHFALDKPIVRDSGPWDPNIWQTIAALVHYRFHRQSSPLRAPPFEIAGFIKSGLNPQLNYPDIQLYFFPIDTLNKGLSTAVGFDKETFAHVEKFHKTYANKGIFMVLNLHPRSTGSISLNQSDPFGPPVIDYQYYQDPIDLEVVVKGFKEGLKFLQDDAFRQFGLTVLNSEPKCAKHKFLSNEHLRCVSEHQTLTIFHPTSTCRMGPKATENVVDSRLRVHGVSKLRVADASIMPHVTSGNTNAPCMMIGEMVAQFIKEDHRL